MIERPFQSCNVYRWAKEKRRPLCVITICWHKGDFDWHFSNLGNLLARTPAAVIQCSWWYYNRRMQTGKHALNYLQSTLQYNFLDGTSRGRACLVSFHASQLADIYVCVCVIIVPISSIHVTLCLCVILVGRTFSLKTDISVLFHCHASAIVIFAHISIALCSLRYPVTIVYCTTTKASLC